jgi:hypothetical protein
MVSASSMTPHFERESGARTSVRGRLKIGTSAAEAEPPMRQQYRVVAKATTCKDTETVKSTPLEKENESVMITRFGDAGHLEECGEEL